MGSQRTNSQLEADREGADGAFGREVQLRIRRIHSEGSRGVWCLCLFLLVSWTALWDFEALPGLSPSLRSFLGHAPSPNWISLALVVYAVSAVIVVVGKIVGRKGDFDGLSHVGFLSAIYGFYHFARALRANFWPVFGAGLVILSLSALGMWIHAGRRIRAEEERLKETVGSV